MHAASFGDLPLARRRRSAHADDQQLRVPHGPHGESAFRLPDPPVAVRLTKLALYRPVVSL